MILKTLALSVLTAAILIAATSQSPLSIGSRSTDTGGTKAAIDAYSDGAGVLVINQASDTKVDNSAMNNLVFKYGDAAKKDGVSLTAEVKTISSISSVQEKSLADKIGLTNYGGTSEVVAAPKLIAVPTCADVAMTWNVSTSLCEKSGVLTYTATSNNNYSCPSGGTLSGTTCSTSSTYAAIQDVGGYTISASSITATSGLGLQKTANGFRTYYNASSVTQGNEVYLLPDGSMSESSIGSHLKMMKVGTGFAFDWVPLGTPIGATVYKSGAGISGVTIAGIFVATSGPALKPVAPNSTFRAEDTSNGSVGATISWVPFYNGAYSCPSGGELSGTTCTINQNYPATNTQYYTCISGGSLSGSTCTINTFTSAPGICQTGYTLTANQCVQN